MIGCMYKYYIFKNNGDAIEFQASEFNFDDILKENYPNLRIDDFDSNTKTLLFNALFSSNRELLDKIIDLYNSRRRKEYLNFEEYNYIALISTDQYAHDYGFLKYKDSSVKTKEKREKLIPIIYKTDLAENNNDKDITLNDLIYPKLAIKTIITNKEKNNNNSQYINDLKNKLRIILMHKYKERLPFADPNYVGKDFGYEEISSNFYYLINNTIINEEYKSDSSLWKNLLSLIAFYDRYKRIYDEKGKILNIKNLNNTQEFGYFTIFSDSDIKYGRKEKEKNNENSLLQMEINELLEINKYNEKNDTYYTVEDKNIVNRLEALTDIDDIEPKSR